MHETKSLIPKLSRLIAFALIAVVALSDAKAEAAPGETHISPVGCEAGWIGGTYKNATFDHWYSIDFNRNSPTWNADAGAPAIASASGTLRTFWNAQGGHSVIIDFGDGTEAYYGHLSAFRNPRSGKRHTEATSNITVNRGEVIGYIGTTGTGSTTEHLHFTFRKKGTTNKAGKLQFAPGGSPFPHNYKWNPITSAMCNTNSTPTQPPTPTPDRSPVGSFDSATGEVRAVTVVGWTFDPDNPTARVAVDIYIGGASSTPGAERHRIATGTSRPDVKQSHPQTSPNQGFTQTISTSKRGEQQVCAYALGDVSDGNTDLGCTTVQILDGTPPPAVSRPTCAVARTQPLRVQWQPIPASPNVTGYEISHSSDNGAAGTQKVPSSARWVDLAVPNGEYNVTIRAFNDTGTGPWSEPARCAIGSPPQTPTAPTCMRAPAGNLAGKWLAPDSDSEIISYTVEWRNPDSIEIGRRRTGGSGPGGSVHDAKTGATIRVIAESAIGLSAPSAWSAPCPAPATEKAPATAAMCGGLEVTVNLELGETPTEGNDVIRGTKGDDNINGLGGNDTICALQGNDIINGGDGSDRVLAGSGNDTITGGSGNDLLVGGPGNDTIRGGNGNDRIQGGDGADNLQGDNGKDRLAGGNGNDIIRGGKFDDKLFGNLGSDQLFGDEGNDVIRGGAWKDIMNGGAGNNDGCTLNDPGGLTETRVNCESGVFGR